MYTELKKHIPATLSSLPPDIDYQRFSRRAARLRSRAFTSSWAQFGNALKRGLQAWSERRRERHAVAELKRLNRHELRDLGLYPGDLDRLQQGGSTTKALESERRAARRGNPARPPKLRIIAGKTVGPEVIIGSGALRKCG